MAPTPPLHSAGHPIGPKRLAIVGATGMVGGNALRYALGHSAVARVTAIGRRALDISHPKLNEVLHRDFADCSALAETLSSQDAAIFCLGAYTGVVPDAELRTITVDYTVEFARVLRGSSPEAAFSFLSGSGADPTGRSRLVHFERPATSGGEVWSPQRSGTGIQTGQQNHCTIVRTVARCQRTS